MAAPLDVATGAPPPPAVPEARGSWSTATCWALLTALAAAMGIGAQLASTGRSRLLWLTLSLVLGLPSLLKGLRQCWWLYRDQLTENERMKALLVQMQHMTLGGDAGAAAPDGTGGDHGATGGLGATTDAPPPGIPLVPGVTTPMAFPGGAGGPWGGFPAAPAPAAASPLPPAGAASLGDLGAWAGAPSAAAGSAPSPGAPAPLPTYQPAAAGALVRAQALEITELLKAFSAAKATDFHWGRRFWMSVWAIEAQGQLKPEVKRLLAGYGYVGETTVTAPREAEVLGALDRLAAQSAMTCGSGPWAGGAVQDMAAAKGGSEETRWGSSLPADLQRAAPEIYRNIRGEGSTSVRDWIAQRYQGSRSSPVWVDLWTLATSVDFRLRDCSSDVEIMQVLAVDDMMEIALRRLASYVYEQRSGDRVGAQHMLGTVPPGGSADVAPTWMVASATTPSKTEHQRRERVESELKNRKKKGDPKGGGRGDGGQPKGGGRGGPRR